MSLRRYCVLWIPTRLHKEIHPILPSHIDENVEQFTREYEEDKEGNILIEEQISLRNILASDDAEKRIFLDLTLLKENDYVCRKAKSKSADPISSCYISKRDIQIEAKDANGKIFDTLLLHCLDARRNGLFMYEYEVQEKYLSKTTDSENKYLLNSNLNITNALYHSIKSFYHVHEFHSPNKDSLLHPFSSEVRINLNCPNNLALLHYLDEFEKKFLDEDDFTKSLKSVADKTYRSLLAQKENIDISTDPETYSNILAQMINCMETGYIECLNQCNSILNIHVYYQSLFYSKHNKIFNLKYDDSHKYELCEEYLGTTRQTKKSVLTLKSYDSQLLIPNNLRKSNTSLGVNECYKKAINIHNAIESINLRQKELSTIINKEFLALIYSYSNQINKQANDIQAQTLEIKKQTKEVNAQTVEIKNLTETTSNLSSKLTKKTTAIGVLAGFLSSAIFFAFSLLFTYSPKDDLQIITKSMTVSEKQLQEQIDTHNQQLEEIKKLIIDLNSKIKKEKEKKPTLPKSKK